MNQERNYAPSTYSASSIPSMMDGRKSSKGGEASTPSVSAKSVSSEKCSVCSQESGALEELYYSDRGSSFPFSQDSKYSNYARETNSLWIDGGSEKMQYVAVPRGAQLMLIATTSEEGDGYLYESKPDGRTAREDYYFLPYNQIAFLAEDAGRHTLVFSANGQMSDSVTIDVLDSQETPAQHVPAEPRYQRQSYQQEEIQSDWQEYQSAYQQQSYQTNFQKQDYGQQSGFQQDDFAGTGYSGYPQEDAEQSGYQDQFYYQQSYPQQSYEQQSVGQADYGYGQMDARHSAYQQQDNRQPYNQEPYYGQGDYQQQKIQQGYSQKSYATSPQAAAEKELLALQRSFWQNSVVKLDESGLLTMEGVTGTEYYLQASSTVVMTRGLFFDGVLYILVANPSTVTAQVTVDPQLGDWSMQDIEILYGDLAASKTQDQDLMRIDVPAFGSGLIIVQPPRKRYSFSVGPRPQSSFSTGGRAGYSTGAAQRPSYGVTTCRQGYSFSAGPKPAYSFRIGY